MSDETGRSEVQISNSERDALQTKVEEQFASLWQEIQQLTTELGLLKTTAEHLRAHIHKKIERLVTEARKEETSEPHESESTFHRTLDGVKKNIFHPRKNHPQLIPAFQESTVIALARISDERWKGRYILDRGHLLVAGFLLENQGYTTYAQLSKQTGYAANQMRHYVLSLQRYLPEEGFILEGSDETGWKLSTTDQAEQAVFYQI